ncbi:ComEA family DNA-binding protein [Pseudomonas cichorii]|nr:ComEA family DNA-binding protein [Pseudomonas cichorii]MBX8559174.1 ComEA family DNA-binding protein [Pseudomonas cichorii]MBX8568337.1 ComEA family DNA-binding protein [Pseudomonas cichorii]MBX8578332.1 ComEA family DNA-binding protein [Pseudomonas cichorii]
MRADLFSTLFFALLTSFSVAVTAAPAGQAMTDKVAPHSVTQEQKVDRVNINQADAETLQKALAGIGKNKAMAIVSYRETNGAFASVEELIEVKGIGKAILDKNRDKLTVE